LQAYLGNDAETQGICEDIEEGEVMSAAEERWHGWTVAGKSLHVGPLPGRKSICLYTSEANVGLVPLAYFRSEGDAATCLAWLDRLAGSRFVLDTLEEAGPCGP